MNSTCEYCEKLFQAQRVTARFCSAKCRVKFNREQKRKQENGEPAAKLRLLMDESDKVSHSLRQSLAELKVNRTNRLLERINALGNENSRLINEMIDLLAK